ncbi:unnamed protein product [Prunus armeniaca]|uniref:Peptidase S54 rhomboid domain-containing protein n=1 Tax=Prunus armeniaca TaxID=36596 RepID=A0A6J5WEG8_PRUAR|nr:unnamed protein product [Prunus armeniaca]
MASLSLEHSRASTPHQLEENCSRPIASKMSVACFNCGFYVNVCFYLDSIYSGTNEKQLRSLDSYLGKLQNGINLPADKSNRTREPLTRNGQLRLKKGLESLDDYFRKLNKDGDSENYTFSSVDLTEDNPTEKLSSINQDSEKSDEREEQKSYRNPRLWFSGNLISFLHTPEPTVGGTGPIFAMMGAWLTYQVQNKDIISKEVSEGMFRKAVITTLLSFTLSCFGPIDDCIYTTEEKAIENSGSVKCFEANLLEVNVSPKQMQMVED